MKRAQVVTGIFALILIACLFGVQGENASAQTEVIGQTTPYQSESIGQTTQYPMTSSDYPTAPTSTATSSTVSQYSQYYTMGPAPNAHVTAPQLVDLTSKMPITVYFGYEQQPVPFSQYKFDPAFAEGNSLWIQGPSSWTQYATVPLGASLSLLAISPTAGSGYIHELDPNGKTNNYNYYFYPTSSLGFYADSPGRHAVNFVIGDKASNQVVIDVEGSTYTAPSYYKPPYYYNGYYYPYYDWWWPGFFGEGERHEGGETNEGGGGTGGTGGGGTGGTGGGGTGGGGQLPGQVGEHGQSGEHGQAGEHGQGAAVSAAARAK
ncbi:MAG: hypothetical protein LUQ22_04340 [Methanotrichaceae archaeon]|nr:hypothetical protein [Methanotrichaceae archaeon]